ncbi:MAG: hypothetical protein QE285_14820 [Aquabacterium sp.]|nr:hypothetical protein [Aquabacterium sp.]
MKSTTSFISIAAAMLVATSQAAAVTLDFEDLAEGVLLSNQYAGLGVIFSANAHSGGNNNSTAEDWATNTGMTITGDDVSQVGGPALASGKLLHSFNDFLDADGDPSIMASFTAPIDSFSADFVGIDPSLLTGGATLTAFNGPLVVGFVEADACSEICQQTLSISAPSITRVAFAPGTFDDWVGVDNISFTLATPIPEAGSAVMLALGLGLLPLALRRRRN